MKTTQTPIKLDRDEFEAIRSDIQANVGTSGLLSWVLKRDQCWTWRNAPFYERGEPVYIDFWADSAKAMFLLKYSHLIAKSLKKYGKNTG